MKQLPTITSVATRVSDDRELDDANLFEAQIPIRGKRIRKPKDQH